MNQSAETMTIPSGNAIVSASIPLPDYIWMAGQCDRLKLSKSAFLAKLIAEARARKESANA